jgi:hypothetical protein
MRRHVIRAESGCDAFVPPPLSPDMTLTPDLVRFNSRADRTIGLLAGACRTLPNPYLLSRSLI